MNKKQDLGVPDPVETGLALVESTAGLIMPFGDRVVQMARKWFDNVAYRRDLQNFEMLMAELADHNGSEQEVSAWLEERIVDPDVEEQLLSEFERMRRARGRSARLSIARLFASYAGNQRPIDEFFSDAGALLAEVSDTDIAAIIELLDLASPHKAMSLHIKVYASEVAVLEWDAPDRSTPRNSTRYPFEDSRVQEFTRAVVSLKRAHFASELPGGLDDIVSAPGNMGIVANNIVKCTRLREVLVRTPSIGEDVVAIFLSIDRPDLTVVELCHSLDRRIPGGIQMSELRECLERLAKDGLVELDPGEHGKAIRVRLRTTATPEDSTP